MILVVVKNGEYLSWGYFNLIFGYTGTMMMKHGWVVKIKMFYNEYIKRISFRGN